MAGPKLEPASSAEHGDSRQPDSVDCEPSNPVPAPQVAAPNAEDAQSADSATGGTEADIEGIFASGDRRQIAPAIGTMLHAARGLHPEISKYCVVAIFDEQTSIGSYELDRIYQGLSKRNANRDQDVLLLLLSNGGSIEPAYQISKLCKAFARSKFAVAVPRFAKSAATLIALGADEIHMGILGHLGPIDPQVGGLPALAVARALDALAVLAEKHPGSSQMLGLYLKEKLAVQQIGYYERVAESAVQYGQRLLKNKDRSVLASDPATIAHTLVHEFKDHGFVIDPEEARELLGAAWVHQGTPEAAFADKVYSNLDFATLMLTLAPKNKGKKIVLIGSLAQDDLEHTTLII